MRRLGLGLLLLGAIYAPRVMQRSSRGRHEDERKDAGGWRWLLEAEPYKIAIAAFYALCLQRIFETSISSLEESAPHIEVSSSGVAVDATTGHIVLLCQMVALLIWLGLYFINNVRLYFLVPDSAPFRRTLTHVVLTVALSEFYFLAATTGRPSTNQLLLILSVVATDALFPWILGPVVSFKFRVLWAVRGLLQTTGVLCILVFVSPSEYDQVGWSAGLLALMLAQLLVIGPAERRWHRRSAIA